MYRTCSLKGPAAVSPSCMVCFRSAFLSLYSAAQWFDFFLSFVFNYVCVLISVCRYMCESVGVHRGQRLWGSPGAAVTDGCQLSDVGAGDGA